MDKQIYLFISDRLKQRVPDLAWIDYDWGQLNQERPPVQFPCALIDIAFNECKDMAAEAGNNEQMVTATVALKLAFEPVAGSQVSAPDEVREFALKPLDTIEKVHVALQGWNGNGIFLGLSRKRSAAAPTRSSLKVYNVSYETRFINTPD